VDIAAGEVLRLLLVSDVLVPVSPDRRLIVEAVLDRQDAAADASAAFPFDPAALGVTR
jgi:hypothetical protein